MAVKTIKEKKSATKKTDLDPAEKVSKSASKKKVVDEEDVDASDVDDDLEEEVDDDWGKTEDDDSWDPDFEEFDIPKKSTKKAGKGKKGSDDDDDLGLDDDLNLDDDLFDDKDEFDDDF
jgi:DNA-directed RNA polymerase subunit delta